MFIKLPDELININHVRKIGKDIWGKALTITFSNGDIKKLEYSNKEDCEAALDALTTLFERVLKIL